MKKSFLSFLLGVVVIASTSVFVSCQDYQDEFKDLQEQIDEEHPKLDNQIAALEAAVAALEEQHDKDVAALEAADKQLEELISDEIAKANAYALAQAQQALADAKAYADAVAAQEAEEALKEAQAYADKIAAAEAQKEAQAALLAANEQSQALYNDAIAQLNKAVDAINASYAQEKSEREAADAALESAYKAADAEIWTALNKAQKDIETAQAAAEKAQATADEALALANTNATSIANEIARAQKAEEDLKAADEAEAARAKAEEAKIWEAINEANEAIKANAARIETVYNELNEKIDGALDRIKTLENKVATLQEEMKAAQETLNDHQTRIEALEAWTAAYQPIIEDLQARMSEAETKIADLYTKLAAEEAARIAADADLQAQITANAQAIAQEVADRAAAVADLQAQITANKTAIAENKAAIEALQTQCQQIWAALDTETSEREDADADLQQQIDAVVADVAALDSDITALDTKVANYYTELTAAIKEVNDKFNASMTNPFEVISEVDFQAAVNPTHEWEVFKDFTINVAGKDFTEPMKVVGGSYKQTPGTLYVLLAPQGNNFTGHQLYVRNERNADLPWYTFGTAKATDANDPIFNAGSVSHAVTRGDVTGPIWKADISAETPSEAAMVAQAKVARTGATELFNGTSTASTSMAYAVVAEYTQKDSDLVDQKLLVWDENFDFAINAEDWCKYDTITLAVKAEAELKADEYKFNLNFKNETDTMIYKQAITCVKAYDVCGAEDIDAQAAVNKLSDQFYKALNYGELTNGIEINIPEKYRFYTFEFLYEVWDKNGDVATHQILKATAAPKITATSQTFNFVGKPVSSDPAQTVAPIAIADKHALLWNKILPNQDCVELTATLTAVKNVSGSGALTFVIPNAGLSWDAFDESGKSDDYSKNDIVVINSLAVTYNPALLSLYETYEYKLTIKYEEVVISESPVTFQMERPSTHAYTLTPITSAWNAEKTKTIVWAKKGNDAMYNLAASFTDLNSKVVEGDDCVIAFRDSTDYSTIGKTDYEITNMPEFGDYTIEVPAKAVYDNAVKKTLDFNSLVRFYKISYGTEEFGFTTLYGDNKEFEIAFCSPIYYDGVNWNYEKKAYEGGCQLAEKEYLVQFPNKQTVIASTDFIGSNDPSTSVNDPITYFGASRDERIASVTVEMGDAAEIAGEYPDYYVWNDATNEYLFSQLPEVTDAGIEFTTYDNTPSLQSIPAFYYNIVVTDIWGCQKKYPFIIIVNPNTPMN